MTLRRREAVGLLQPVLLSARMVRYRLQNVRQVEQAGGAK